jgi:hypothetical protein
VLALTVSEARRITAIDVIADPDRRQRLNLSLLPGDPGPRPDDRLAAPGRSAGRQAVACSRRSEVSLGSWNVAMLSGSGSVWCSWV